MPVKHSNVHNWLLLPDLVKTAKTVSENHRHSPQKLLNLLGIPKRTAKNNKSHLAKSPKIVPFLSLTNVTIVNIIATKR